MAAPSLNVVRVRLHFDYPPPAVSTCRMCWLLVDLNRCRVVADLVSVIREKFDYSRKTCLDLFIEDCYLPPSESIYVVRDNDSIRVKAESLSLQNGTESETSKASKVKKRRREAEEQEAQDEQSNTGALKKRKATEESQATQLGVTENVKKKKKSKKRKRKEEQTETAKKTLAVAAVTKPLPEKSGKKQQPSTSALNGKPAARKPEETSSDSSDSSEEEPPKRPNTQQKKVSGSAGPVSKPVSAAKRKDKSSSSDSDTDSGSVQPPPKKPTPAKSIPAKPANATTVNTKPKQPPSKKQAQSSSSDSDSDSDSSSSAERPPPKRTPVRIPPPVPSSNPKTKASASASAAVSAGSSKKPAAKTAETSSDSDSSSSSERPPVKKPSALCTPKAPTSAPCTPKAPSSSAPSPALKPGEQPSAKPASSGSDSDRSEEEIELVIRKPLLNGMGLSVAEVVSSSPFVGAGRGRGDGRSPGRGLGRGEGRFARRGSCSRDRGRGGGRGNGTPWNKGFRYDSDEEQKRNRRFNDSLTNTSLILQNPPEPTPPRDYSGFPLLAAPPAVGQKIAFKLLELTENYSPEVSAYKEGKITGFNVTTNVIELQLLSRPKVPLEPGKFDLVYENADGSEVVEYAVTQGSQNFEMFVQAGEHHLLVVVSGGIQLGADRALGFAPGAAPHCGECGIMILHAARS